MHPNSDLHRAMRQEARAQALYDFETEIVEEADDDELREIHRELERDINKTRHDIAKMQEELEQLKAKKDRLETQQEIAREELIERNE